MSKLIACCATALIVLLPACSSVSEPPQDGLFQVIIEARDVEAQAVFYRDVMGCRIVDPRPGVPLAGSPFVRLHSGTCFLALHRAMHARGPVRLSFRSEDLQALGAKIARGGGSAATEVRNPAPGVFVLDARDPEGNVLHIERHAPPSSVADSYVIHDSRS